MQPIDWLYRSASIRPDALAVDAAGVCLSYAELVARVDAFAVALQAAAPKPRSRIGICAHNTVEHLVALLGVMASGNIWVPLNPRDARTDLDSKLDIARPALIVADEDCLPLVEHAATRLIVGRSDNPASGCMARLIAAERGARPRRDALAGSDTQAIKFTGGSSGTPKGVMQPYRAWIAGAVNMLQAFRFGSSDRFLLSAPLTHGTSCYVAPMLAAGGTLVLLDERPTTCSILDALRDAEISATFLPPTLIYMLMDVLKGAHHGFGSLRLLIYGAAPMPAARIREAQSVFGPVLAANYGLTEAPQIITVLTPEEARDERLASAGRAGFTTRVAIKSESGEQLPPGEAGEIVVGGDLIMTGYLDQPEQTAETIKCGWLHTGDLGHMDEQGFVYITDRIKDVIISGGFNVYPGEVERALAAHPAISECVVFGVADRKWGEAVHAAITLRNGKRLNEIELIRFAKDHLGSVKAPKQIHLLNDFPRSSVGKVQRRKVRELVEAGAPGDS